MLDVLDVPSKIVGTLPEKNQRAKHIQLRKICKIGMSVLCRSWRATILLVMFHPFRLLNPVTNTVRNRASVDLSKNKIRETMLD